MTLLTVGLLVVIVALIAVIAMLLGGGPRERRGGTIDLSPATARGELDLDWSDPRTESPHQPAVIFDNDGSFACVGASGYFAMPLHGDAKGPVLLTTSPSG